MRHTSDTAVTVAHVDIGNLRHNLRVIKGLAGDAELLAVVKANAYGHGAVPISTALVDEGVRRLAVATIGEGVELRQAGFESAILVMGAPLPEHLSTYSQFDLEVTISSSSIAELIHQSSGRFGALSVHVKLDTGMHRLGVDAGDATRVVRLLERTPGVRIAGLWTHLADSDDPDSSFMDEQERLFSEAVGPLRDSAQFVHIANSGALLRGSTFADGRTLIRAGIALYGYPPSEKLADRALLKPLLRFCSRVVHVAEVAAGETVSYGRTWRAPSACRIATIAAGYADGYPRNLSNRGLVGIASALYPVAGTVCMDMMMVDIGDARDSTAGIAVGDEAVLFGSGGPSAESLAKSCGTIPYELCCRISGRVPRRYTDSSN